MNTTQKNITNYFDALQQLYSSWLKAYKATLTNDWSGFTDKARAQIFTNRLEHSVKKLEKMALKQQEYINNITPEQFQKEVISSMDSFEKFFDESVITVKEKLTEQRKYVKTNDFITDVKENSERASEAYNEILVGITDQMEQLIQKN